MKNFILDTNPNFSEATAKVGEYEYKLKMIKHDGCRITMHQKLNGDLVERDSLVLTRDDMKAFFMMLCANCRE